MGKTHVPEVLRSSSSGGEQPPFSGKIKGIGFGKSMWERTGEGRIGIGAAGTDKEHVHSIESATSVIVMG